MRLTTVPEFFFCLDILLSNSIVKLVLQKNRYFLETIFPDVLETLLKDDIIRNARVIRTDDSTQV